MLSPVTVIFDRLLLLSSNHLVFYAFSQMSTNVPINHMTVTPIPTSTIPLVPIDVPAILGTKETEEAAILVSLLTLRHERPQFVMILAFRILYLSLSSYKTYFGKLVLENTYLFNMCLCNRKNQKSEI